MKKILLPEACAFFLFVFFSCKKNDAPASIYPLPLSISYASITDGDQTAEFNAAAQLSDNPYLLDFSHVIKVKRTVMVPSTKPGCGSVKTTIIYDSIPSTAHFKFNPRDGKLASGTYTFTDQQPGPDEVNLYMQVSPYASYKGKAGSTITVTVNGNEIVILLNSAAFTCTTVAGEESAFSGKFSFKQ